MTGRRKPTPRERGWGGWRPGSGRKPGPNPRVRHLSREAFAARYPCHVTMRMRDDVPSLRIKKLVLRLERSLVAGCDRGDFRVVHYSLLPNQAHFIVEASGRQALGRGMKSLTRRLMLAVNEVFERRGPVFGDRYRLRVLRTPLEVRRALAAVLLSAPRHASRRRETRIDAASSGPWFDGWKRQAAISKGAAASLGPPPVAPPRTWLLRQGWRRLGLVDPEETPRGTR